jgi:hypothetical protein
VSRFPASKQTSKQTKYVVAELKGLTLPILNMSVIEHDPELFPTTSSLTSHDPF